MNQRPRRPTQRKIDDRPASNGPNGGPDGDAPRAGVNPPARLRFHASQARIWALLASLGPVDLSRDRIVDQLRAHDPTLPSASIDGIINGMEHRGMLTRRIVSDDVVLYRIKPVGDARRDGSPARDPTPAPASSPQLASSQFTSSQLTSRHTTSRSRRPTRSADPILDMLAASGDAPLSRSDLHRQLARAGRTMSLSTVYRTMSSLERKGLVLTEWGVDREARYRIKPAGFETRTLVLRCASTGRRVEIADRALLGRLIGLAQEHGLDAASKTITVTFSAE